MAIANWIPFSKNLVTRQEDPKNIPSLLGDTQLGGTGNWAFDTGAYRKST
jgi:hypothetical protein